MHLIGLHYSNHLLRCEMNQLNLDDDMEDVASMVVQGQVPGFQPENSGFEEEYEQAPCKTKKRDFDDLYRRFEIIYFTSNFVYLNKTLNIDSEFLRLSNVG